MAARSTTVQTQRSSSMSTSSSAYSPYAYPNEDWTKISDLAERRRIQNRIAQRNYRQKLKRRLEDLESRAFSNSASPEPVPKQKSQQQHRPTHVKAKSSSTLPTKTNWQHSPTPSFRNSVSSFDEEVTLSHYGYGLPSPAIERSAMSSYPLQDRTAAQELYAANPWFQSQVQDPYWTSYGACDTTSTPMSAYQTTTHVKQEQEDDTLNNYSLNSFGGVNTSSSMRGSAQYTSQPDSYTPSLSDCFDESLSGSFADNPEDLFGSYPTPPASVAADDSYFSNTLAQALAADDSLFLTPSMDMEDFANFGFMG